ncbi:ABC transporter permease [Corynebacterium sp. TAE3-ERU12]|uniref:ABC transporter permease n=1 Tax=Corynebacterium sp. TAE3-ERU12 TaxID=2849491 RepID=UPI001C45350A|nr:ABC transporter permease [Corynebacterium sp. TAE3-ERU12]MBV7295158.1 ABC transporter permease [Corynebacterium sp. TAE3-ERU12]
MKTYFPDPRCAVGFVPATLSLTGALLRSWMRNPVMAVQSIIFPAFLLMVFDTVFGSTVTRMGGTDSIGGTAALIALVSVQQGTLTSAVYVTRDRDSGLLDRQWSLPFPHGAILSSKVLAEFLRGSISTIIMLAIGFLLGLRFSGGLLPVVAAIGLSALFGVACCLFILALAANSDEKTVLMVFSSIFLLQLFFNTGFAPLESYPGWMQPLVEYQPMSPAIDAMRAFFDGTVDVRATTIAVAWVSVMIAVFGVWAQRSMSSIVGSR